MGQRRGRGGLGRGTSTARPGLCLASDARSQQQTALRVRGRQPRYQASPQSSSPALAGRRPPPSLRRAAPRPATGTRASGAKRLEAEVGAPLAPWEICQDDEGAAAASVTRVRARNRGRPGPQCSRNPRQFCIGAVPQDFFVARTTNDCRERFSEACGDWRRARRPKSTTRSSDQGAPHCITSERVLVQRDGKNSCCADGRRGGSRSIDVGILDVLN